MRAAIFTTLAIWALGSQATYQAAPVKPPAKVKEKAKEPKAVPDVAMHCQYGELTQFGRELTLAGPTWNASGSIRADGKILLVWVLIGSTDGKSAPSLYELKEDTGELIGLWGWAPDAYMNDAGEMKGDVRADRMYPVGE